MYHFDLALFLRFFRSSVGSCPNVSRGTLFFATFGNIILCHLTPRHPPRLEGFFMSLRFASGQGFLGTHSYIPQFYERGCTVTIHPPDLRLCYRSCRVGCSSAEPTQLISNWLFFHFFNLSPLKKIYQQFFDNLSPCSFFKM